MSSLAGRIALVTGGGRGIGKAIATQLAKGGARVVITGRDASVLQRTADELDCVAYPADATSLDDMRAVFDAVGPVDILVNNAGAALSRSFLKHSAADFDSMLAVNLTAAFQTTQLALGGMTARGWGRVVNIASTAGLKGYAYTTAYCAAKHGLIGFTRALATEIAKSGITVNAVCPGFTDTDLVSDAVATISRQTGKSDIEARSALASYNPQGRLIEPAEVATAVAFLCGPEAASITGQSLVVAGGEIM